MSLRILHLSDTHVRAERARHYGKIDTSGLLEAAVAAAGELAPCQAIVVSGDISDDGTPASYDFAARTLAPLAERWDAPVVWACGNHDRRPAMREALDLPGAPMDPIFSVTDITVAETRWRFVAADSSVPGRGFGYLGEQIHRIEDAITNADSTPGVEGVPCPGIDTAPIHSVLVLHHPPLAAPTVLHGALRLMDAPRLAQGLQSWEVAPAVVLAGHYHLAGRGRAGGVPVVVGPALANETTLGRGPEWESARARSAFSVVQISEASIHQDITYLDDVAAALPSDIEPGEEIFAYSPEEVVAIGRRAGRPGWSPSDPLAWDGPGSYLLENTLYASSKGQ
ncbi:metallophosphoesterase [Actinotignum sanguinis]|uniref:Metallophosphoesterase n=2 Tax=Actinomycetaceae TaxID=2049 RepID=A0ABZ0RBX8_9ACTO|nr:MULTISPECIES: metallophosphoesterase [Actinotignum]WPJ89343.1 metallophosphoesterase [Schaalia turicensis]MDE1552343.1 metallophosphoesterase [Actinotignum sanguinis]MDE1565973.1 metallophosphoesterase [Actinotignum sanguinis]MDE1577266.1 metallophosphoesterase [Actinotignum sanguinis]MDE1641849.1 metallophosphoesterase [Actinotignum sanguinis]